MNTITSFNRNNQYQMKNNRVQSNVQFQGLNVRMLTPKGRRIQRGIMDHHTDIAHHLQQDVETIIDMTKGASLKKLNLLDRLANRALSITYNHPEKAQEVGDCAVSIFKKIKKPSESQAYIISHGHGSFNTIDRIFTAAHNDPKRFKFAVRVNKEILDTRDFKHSEMTAELLESKNSDKYVHDFDSYKSYLLLNRKDKDAVKNLDKIVESGQYDARKYDIEIKNNRIFASDSFSETPVLNKKVLTENYTDEGDTFINYFINNFGIKNESLQAGNDKDLLDMYKSTTKDNLDTRLAIIDKFHYHKFFNVNSKGPIEKQNKEVSALKELYHQVESDKHAENFVLKTINDNIDIDKVQEYVDILNTADPKKLDIYYHNAKNIIHQTSGEKRIKALSQEIENPFYKTPERIERENYEIQEGYAKKPSIIKKAKKYFYNEISKIRYKMSNESAKPQKEVKAIDISTIEMPKFEPLAKEPVISKPVSEVKEILPAPIAEVKEAAPVKVAETVKEVAPAAEVKAEKPVKAVKVSRFVPKAPNAKKLAVINDVNGIIEKKLGPKVLEDQKREYAIKATKMRMSMLPEIFASIKETRAADRKAGKKLNVSNKDAYSLYSIINGRNKKLVNYMLKKRNADGTRMFNIKDIITTVNDAEKKVRMDKYAAPKTYRAADAKAYFNELLDSKIQQYGKLERSKKTK